MTGAPEDHGTDYRPTPEEKMIPTRMRCGVCNQVSAVGFWVPNDIWDAVVHPHYHESIHCLACFTSHADEKLIRWDQEITFYPVSFATHLEYVRGVLGTSVHAAYAAACDWQDINTAPKDGTGVLITGIDATGSPWVVKAHWGCLTHSMLSSRHHSQCGDHDPSCKMCWMSGMGYSYGGVFQYWKHVPKPPEGMK